MKKKIILFLICMLLISFGLGVFTGYGKLIPDSVMNDFGLKQPKIHQNSYMNLKNYSLIPIHVNDSEDISKLRSDLIHYIWKEQPFENLKSLIKIEENIIDTNYDDLENLKQIDKFLISMEYDVNSTSYLFLPHDSNNELILYHQGHGGDFYNGKNTIEYFLKNGYSVLAFSMPLLGINNQPIVDTEFGKIKLVSHEYFRFIESQNFSPLKFYFEPLSSSLNYIENNFNFTNFYMIGISGGGWTTTVYSAIDERISKSFSIAGSIPISLRININDLGDYEQTLPDFYKTANYLDLYVLASYGDNRKHVQIFNKYDPCCFSGNLFKNYENQIEITVSQLGKGSFQIYLDDTHHEHKISENALDIIIKEIGE
jgi:hypothetical protein